MPAPLGDEIAALLARLGGRPQMAGLSGLWKSWNSQMGAELAALAWPAGHRKDILLLGCADSCAMQEARMRAGEYVSLANAWLGSEFFSDARPFLNRPDLRAKAPVQDENRAKKKISPTKSAVQLAKRRPTGKFLADMAPDSPVALCYARFCGIAPEVKSQKLSSDSF